MARKQKDFNFIGKRIMIKELRVKDILKLMEVEGFDTTVDGIKTYLEKNMGMAFDGLDQEDLLEAAPSELEELYAEFMEVNTSFFGIARKVGLSKMVETVKESIAKDFSALSANLYRQGMAQRLGTTDTPSS